MRLVKASVLAVALAAFAAPAFADCGAAHQEHTAQTTVTPSGAQSTVPTQTASQTGK